MSNIAVVTDSNSGLLPEEAALLEDVYVIPMPVIIGSDTFYEGIDITQQRFYEVLSTRTDLSTSQPSLSDVTDLWDKLLEDHDEVVHIPMSSGLSSACSSAQMLANDYDGRVHVVNNQRISVTQKRSVYDAILLRDAGRSGAKIKEHLERVKYESSIYIMVDTLYYLKRGGRITPAAAAVGTALKIKPVLQIQGEKLDGYTVARTVTMARTKMIDAIRKDMKNRFGGDNADNMHLDIAYTYNDLVAEEYKAQVMDAFPGFNDINVDPLSLSVSCHIGPGSLAVACSKKITL
ncbi:MAG: DegV family protein [Lachnospiraceae bacterium]|nr:DegV family protein [Lachnospiraceae bacterium]